MKIKERALALLLSLVMVLTLMPALAFADINYWTVKSKSEVYRLLQPGDEVEIEVVIERNGYTGNFTYKWYKDPYSGMDDEKILNKDETLYKITVNEPGTYRCVLQDDSGRMDWVDLYVMNDYVETGWTSQIKSISVTFAQNEDNSRFTFNEETDKTKIWRWSEEKHDEVEIDGYDYDFCDGDTVTATLTDGSIITVVAKEQSSGDARWIDWYVLEGNVSFQGGDYLPTLMDNQITTPWKPDGDNTFWVWFGEYEDENGNLIGAESTPFSATIVPAVPTEDLAAAKTAAKSELESYKKAADYRTAQQTELANAIAAGKTAIDAATDKAGVASALAAAKVAIDKIKTAAQMDAEEAEVNPQPIDPTPTPIATPTTPQAPAEIIDLPTVKISKPKAAKKKITVKWKKVSKKNLKKISGIQIQVATDPAFTNIVKTATAGKKKTSKVIKGLSPKTKYYVRIRAYAADNHVSAWKSKSIKVK